MGERRRIGIYGGTFDPVHVGHIEIGRRVSKLFAMDEFLFVPALVAPHKQEHEAASPFHRYAMLSLATQNDPKLCVSAFELEGLGTKYTVDTLSHFRATFGDAAELFFVMGADSWAEITSWRDWERLATLAKLIVVTRPGFESPKTGSGTAGKEVFVSDAVMLDISATDVRRAVRENDQVKLSKLVTTEVANYITKYGLYRNTNEA